MISVGRHAKANDFRINFGTAGFGVFVFFEHHNASAPLVASWTRDFLHLEPRPDPPAAAGGGEATSPVDYRPLTFPPINPYTVSPAAIEHAEAPPLMVRGVADMAAVGALGDDDDD